MQRKFLALYFSLLIHSTIAQHITVTGGFSEDSLEVGLPVHFWLYAQYPANLDIVFPDSNYNFSPYELTDKTYFPSKLVGDMLIDSAVYQLQSFEIDPVQYLKLPVFLHKARDTTRLYTLEDSIILKELAPFVTDTTQMRTNTLYQKVNKQFNSPLFLILGAVIAFLVVLFAILFGGRIRRAFLLRKMKKEYIRFSDEFTILLREIKSNAGPDPLEDALYRWKKYMERLEKIPYAKWTTSEILAAENNGELKAPLKAIDRAVYGGHAHDHIYKALQSLEDFTQHRYNQKIESIKHAK